MLKFSGCIVVPRKRGPKVLLAKTKTITDIITTIMTIMSSAMIVSMPRFDLRKRLRRCPRDFKPATPNYGVSDTATPNSKRYCVTLSIVTQHEILSYGTIFV